MNKIVPFWASRINVTDIAKVAETPAGSSALLALCMELSRWHDTKGDLEALLKEAQFTVSRLPLISPHGAHVIDDCDAVHVWKTENPEAAGDWSQCTVESSWEEEFLMAYFPSHGAKGLWIFFPWRKGDGGVWRNWGA